MKKSSVPGMAKRAVTLKDIAERCGVAKTSVTEALRENRVGLAPATVERIRTVAREMGYDPSYHENARRLAMRKTGEMMVNHLVAVFFPPDFLRYNFFLEIFRGIMEGLNDAGFGICVGHIDDLPDGQSTISFLSVLSRGDIDGVIIPGGLGGRSELVRQLRSNHGFSDRPVVSVIDKADEGSSVLPNYRDGYHQAARHLLNLGHRHLLQIVYPHANDSLSSPLNREEGTRQALREFELDPEMHLHRLPFTAEWMNPFTAYTDIPADISQAADDLENADPLIAYLRAHPEVTAILTLNDAYALHTWYALHRAGFRVPEDISLIGLDDTDPMRDAHGRNMLTTIRLPLEEIGRQAVRQLLMEISQPASPPREIVLPLDLIIRGSTGPAA